jgi:protein-tyrosine phosphatase
MSYCVLCMRHVFWVVDELLAGRPGPVRYPWDLEEFWAAGLRSIVSLNTEPDPAEIEATGLRHLSVPLPPILPLSDALQDMLLHMLEGVLDAMHAEVSSGRPTVVHCHAGKDRTGLALSSYLMRYHGLGAGEAIRQVRSVQPVALSAPGYEATARRFADGVQR